MFPILFLYEKLTHADYSYLVGFASTQSQQFTQFSSLVCEAYELCLSALMYSIYNNLSHLTNSVT